MEIINELLGVDGVKIYQNKDAFSFSIDSLLLASFCNVKNAKNIIELGCGNAAVCLYVSLRTNAPITGIEIQENSYNLAKKSVIINKKEKQIFLYNDNLIDISKKIKEKYDLVLANPPFFKYSKTSNINKNDYLTIARHEVLCTLDDICKEASILLKDNGYFCMVHRPDRLTDIIWILRKYKLEPKRLQFVYPKEGKECNHILIEARKSCNTDGLRVLPPLVIHNIDGSYKEKILNIFNNKEE